MLEQLKRVGLNEVHKGFKEVVEQYGAGDTTVAEDIDAYTQWLKLFQDATTIREFVDAWDTWEDGEDITDSITKLLTQLEEVCNASS